MYEKGYPVKINDKEYLMVFSLAAMLAITERYGGIEEMADALIGPADEDGDTEDVQRDKAAARNKARIKSLSELPWLITTLVNQGIMLESGNTNKDNPALLTPEKAAVFIPPKELQKHMAAVMGAIAIGMGTYHGDDPNEERDVVLDELQQKNAEGAAV